MSLHEGPSSQLNRAFTKIIDLASERIAPNNAPLTRFELYSFADRFPRTYAINYPKIFIDSQVQLALSHEIFRLAAPVGEYGEDWARRNLSAINLILKNFDASNERDKYVGNARRIACEYNDTLLQHTSNQTQEALIGSTASAEGVIRTSKEGFQSVFTAATRLTMYKIEGFEDDPDGLLSKLIGDGAISQLSLSIPRNLIGEIGNSGLVFTNPTIIKSGPKFIINPKIIDHFNEGRKSGLYTDETAGADKPLDIAGCPLGRKLHNRSRSGVDMAAKIFADVLAAQKI